MFKHYFKYVDSTFLLTNLCFKVFSMIQLGLQRLFRGCKMTKKKSKQDPSS